MDIENLIEQYRQAADKWEKRHPVTDTFDLRVQDVLRDAATALSTLQDENEKLKRALAEMWFAYVNKDGKIPNTYEEEAVELAQEILGPWGECMPKYLRRGPHKED